MGFLIWRFGGFQKHPPDFELTKFPTIQYMRNKHRDATTEISILMSKWVHAEYICTEEGRVLQTVCVIVAKVSTDEGCTRWGELACSHA